MKRSNRILTYQLPGSGLPDLLVVASFLGIALSLVALATPVQAQAIDEIRVQARATSEAVRDIPVAITALTAETLDNFGLKNLEDVAAFTPSLEIVRTGSGSGASISVRGISSSGGTIGIESSVALILDGVYFPQSRAINEGLFDASQVAILKGPQALYFGKNATAGVVSIRSNDPGDEVEILGKVGYEIEAQALHGEAVFSTPLNDEWGVRLAVAGTKMWQGYAENPAGESTYAVLDAATFEARVLDNPAANTRWFPRDESFFTRLTIKGEPSDVFTMRLKASIADVKQNKPRMSEPFECPTLGGVPHRTAGTGPNMQFPVPAEVGECNPDRVTGRNPIPPVIAASSPDLGRFGGQVGEAYKSYVITGDFEFNFDWVQWQTILNWHQQRVGWVIDADSGPDTAVMASEFSVFDNYAIETRAATDFDGPLNGVLGVYYQQTNRDFRQEVLFAGAWNTAADPTNEFIAYDKISETDGETISVYGELIWDITDQLQLTGGARYIWENKDSFFTQPYVNPFFTGLFVEGRILADDTAYDDLIPEVTLRWQPDDTLTFYLAYKQGFKSGGFDNGSIDSTLNANPIEDITYRPETVEGVEGGVKASFLGGQLNLDFDVYHYKYKDLQLNFFNSASFAFRTLNAGSAETTGAELQATWAPEAVEGLVLNGSVAYTDAHYVNFSAPCSAGQSPADGCPTQAAALKDQDLSGVSRNLAPKWAGNIGFSYSTPVGNGFEIGFSSNAKWKSEYLLSEVRRDAQQSGYVWFDAAIRFGDIDGTWEFAIIGKNLTDKYVLVGARDVASTGGNTGFDNAFPADLDGFVLDPRTIEFQFTMRY